MLKAKVQSFIFPAVLLLLALLSYGLLIPWLGFYWDDWPFAWLTHFLSLRELLEVFSMFRPFDAPFFLLTIPLLGNAPIARQVYGLVVRLASALGLWWALRQLWPAKPRQAAWVSMLFLVFPGFGQQWIAFTHANQEQVPLLAFVLSLGFMARAARTSGQRRRFFSLTALALALMALGLFPSEYYLGLELLRPFILWIVLAQARPAVPRRAARALRLWLPYLLVWLLNAAWLLTYQRMPGYISYGVKLFRYVAAGPKALFLQVIQDVIQTLATAGLSVWSQTLQLFLLPLNAAATWLTLALAAATFLILLAYLLRLEERQAEVGDEALQAENDRWALQAIGLGVAGILLGRAPSWAAGLPLALEFPWDRFFQSTMLGGSLLFVGLLEYLLKTHRRKAVILSLFVALSVGLQFNTANTFRRDWDNQRTFFWQLAWRAPALKPGTTLITHELPLKYVSDNSLIAPLNWTYAPDFSGTEMPYMFVYTTIRLGGDTLPTLDPDAPVVSGYRTRSFHGSTSQALVIYDPVPGCLRVLDASYTGKQVFPDLPYLLADAIHLSDLGRILPDGDPPAAPPAHLFGKEPAHTWCYYFQKAELARQMADWQQVARLEDEARSLGLQAELATEWLPFLEARARLGDWEQAGALALEAAASDLQALPAFCASLERMRAEPVWDAAGLLRLAGLQSRLECAP